MTTHVASLPLSAMGGRQEDPALTPGQHRKRPLSIIEETDSDGETDAVTERNKAIGENSNTTGSSNVVDKQPVAMCHTSTTKTGHTGSAACNDNSQRTISTTGRQLAAKTASSVIKSKSVSKSHSVSAGKVKPDPIMGSAKSDASRTKIGGPSLKSPPPDSKTPASKYRGGRRTALTPGGDSGNKVNGTKAAGKTVKLKPKPAGSTDQHDSARGSHQLLSNPLHKPVSGSKAPLKGANSSDLDTSHKNGLSPQPLLVGDGRGLARIRETAQRLNLTSPPLSASSSSSSTSSSSSSSSSSTSSMPSSSVCPSPKFTHRLRLNPPSLTSSQVPYDANSPDVHFPTITLTPTFGSTQLVQDLPGSVVELTETRGNLSPITSRHSPLLKHKVSAYPFKFSSSFFSRRLSSGSTGSIPEEAELVDDVGGGVSSGSSSSSLIGSPEDMPTSYLSDFKMLKETADKLRLSTRRASVMQWRQKYMDSPGVPKVRSNLNGDVNDERLTSDRKQRINEALDWLRNELQEMRGQDQNLARQLLTIRHDIHQLKLRRCTEEHQELLDDFHSELEELQEFSDVLDLPQPLMYGNNPLKHIGVTRLNLSARRFSAC